MLLPIYLTVTVCVVIVLALVARRVCLVLNLDKSGEVFYSREFAAQIDSKIETALTLENAAIVFAVALTVALSPFWLPIVAAFFCVKKINSRRTFPVAIPVPVAIPHAELVPVAIPHAIPVNTGVAGEMDAFSSDEAVYAPVIAAKEVVSEEPRRPLSWRMKARNSVWAAGVRDMYKIKFNAEKKQWQLSISSGKAGRPRTMYFGSLGNAQDAAEVIHNPPAFVALVGCSSSKLPFPAEADPTNPYRSFSFVRAAELYVSPLFKKSFGYACDNYENVFILSAKHGLVHPTASLERYDVTLQDMSDAERKQWSKNVVESLQNRGFDLEKTKFVMLCGGRYVEPFKGTLEMVEPLAGKQIGQRLSWLKSQGY